MWTRKTYPNNFLNVSSTNRSTSWTLKARITLESNIIDVLESLPFFEGEKRAEVGEAESDGFVSAEVLRIKGVYECPIEIP